MQVNQSPAQGSEIDKQLPVRSERDAWEINAQEFGLRLAIGRSIQSGVDIVEYLLGRGLSTMGFRQC